MPTVALSCHPSTPTDVVRAVAVDVQRTARAVTLRFVIDGDLARVRIPPPSAPRPVHLLWQHTCCEAFVAIADAPAYHELNLAPSSEWMVYAFRDYREFVAAAEDDAYDPGISVRSVGDRLEIAASVLLQQFSPQHAQAALRLGLATVVEDHMGVLSYWALQHPPGVPDFHHRAAFALRLDALGTCGSSRTP